MRHERRSHRLERRRVVAAFAYATLVTLFIIFLVPRGAGTGPILLIALGLPLAFRLVPRNYLDGMRTPRTLWSTEETWYVQNLISGVVMVAVGIVWLIGVALQ